MGASENKEVVRQMFAELSRGNGAGFVAAFADDVRYTVAGSTRFSGTFNGRKELIKKVLNPLGSQLEGGMTVTPLSLVAEGDLVVMQAQGAAKTKSGRPYNNSYCYVFRISDGKVQEVTEYLDTELLTEAFGR